MAEYEEDDGFDREAAEAMAELERDDGSDTEAARAIAELERRGAPRLAPEPAPRPQPPPRREGACVDCGTEALQPKFHAAFGLHVCYDCQRRFKVGLRLRPGHYPGHSDSLTAPAVVSERWRQVPATEQDDG